MSENIIVRRTGQAPLRVLGEVVASDESSSERAFGNYSGSPGRSQEVKIIKTASGKFVVAIHHKTAWQGEHDTDEAAVFPSKKECVEYLSERVPGWMLQELITELGEEAIAEGVE